jgi:5-methylcytosine-specific restriction endonuclease McrA
LPDDERKDFIDTHESECSALRDVLWAVGHAKCWYSEASLQQCEGQVEHYRPKKRLHGARHEGYWWRAFDWENLRLAHPTVNRRKTDYLTGKRVGKGSYFPLRDEARRAQNRAEETNEEPVLLDPVVPSDTLLICFDEASGAPRPRYKREQNEWLHRRTTESIEYYHLNEGTWNATRADLMSAVRTLCDQLEELAVTQPRDEAAYHQKIDEIVAYISPFAEFSSACLQVVRDKGLLEHFVPGL